MNKIEVCEKIRQLLNETVDDESVIPRGYDEDISELLNSVEMVTAIVELESSFNIEIDDNDFEIDNMNSIEHLADLVIKYLNDKKD